MNGIDHSSHVSDPDPLEETCCFAPKRSLAITSSFYGLFHELTNSFEGQPYLSYYYYFFTEMVVRYHTKSLRLHNVCVRLAVDV